MTEKLVVTAAAFVFVLFMANATAVPPGVDVYVPPPQTQQSTTDDQNGQNPPDQGHDQTGVASPDTSSGGKPPAAADAQRRLSMQQRRAMQACMANCLAAGMTGPFCSHSCIPD